MILLMNIHPYMKNNLKQVDYEAAARFEVWMAEQDELMKNYKEPVFEMKTKKLRIEVVKHKDEQLSIF